jgi:hypothetical protein
MQISLKDLLAIVAFGASVAWCATWYGYDDPRFWITVALSAVMSIVFVVILRNDTQRTRALAITICVGLIGLSLPSIALVANAVFLSIAVVLLKEGPIPSTRTLCHTSMGCLLAGLLVGVAPGMLRVQKLKAMRQEFPIVSLVDRLRYERSTKRQLVSKNLSLSGAVAEQLATMESDLESKNYREFQLGRIHSDRYLAFARTMGFGIGRVPFLPSSEYLRQPPLRDIGFDEFVNRNAYDASSYQWRQFVETGKSSDIEHLHSASRSDFIDPNSFGSIISDTAVGAVLRPPSMIAGFIEHALHYSPNSSMEAPNSWIIERLELISLLKFDEPRVYVLDHLPRMDQLSSDEVPTRPLDKFESAALAKLWTEQDVVVELKENHYRMLGSLRAAKQCANCHGVERGELLGAFSYFIRRTSHEN